MKRTHKNGWYAEESPSDAKSWGIHKVGEGLVK